MGNISSSDQCFRWLFLKLRVKCFRDIPTSLKIVVSCVLRSWVNCWYLGFKHVDRWHWSVARRRNQLASCLNQTQEALCWSRLRQKKGASFDNKPRCSKLKLCSSITDRSTILSWGDWGQCFHNSVYFLTLRCCQESYKQHLYWRLNQVLKAQSLNLLWNKHSYWRFGSKNDPVTISSGWCFFDFRPCPVSVICIHIKFSLSILCKIYLV